MTINEIGAYIRNRRKSLGVTQPDLAEMSQININTMYRIERGDANPSVKILNKIADVLGLEISIRVKKGIDR